MWLRENTFNRLYLQALATLLAQGQPQPSGNGSTIELHPVALQLTDMRYRSLCLPQRRKNLLLQLIEFLWIWNGSRELEPVAFAAKQWRQYSDDGQTLWGAYGHRLRYASSHGFDQIKRCIELLQRDPSSRQAVMTIWDGGKDLAEPHKDVPCNDLLHFLIRDGKLDLTVFVRSNDILWGTTYNVWNWCQLLCVIADRLGVPPGVYTHFADSLHLYDVHRDHAAAILSAGQEPPDLGWPTDGATDAQLEWCWRSVLAVIAQGDVAIINRMQSGSFYALPPFWQDYMRATFLCMFCKVGASRADFACSLLDPISTQAIKVETGRAFYQWAVKHYLAQPRSVDHWLESLSSDERRYVTEKPCLAVS